jgi:hypothetical protein
MTDEHQSGPAFSRWMGSMWLYSVLRFGMFFALWGIFELIGIHGLFAAFLGLIVSIPLGYVLLQRPRAAVAGNNEQRINSRREARDELSARLDPDPEPED